VGDVRPVAGRFVTVRVSDWRAALRHPAAAAHEVCWIPVRVSLSSKDMRLTALWQTMKRPRVPTRVEIFREASRERDAGRLDAALELVMRALATAPNSIVGHLFVGNLHLATRSMTPARDAFERVLELDAHQPRALLGLARVAFEEHDGTACRTFLERAIARYPDFPEAQALLEVLTAPVAPAASAVNGQRLVLPAGAHTLALLGVDGTVIAMRPDVADERGAAHVHRVARLASAILQRAGLGSLRDAVIDAGPETTVLRASESATLAVTFPRDVDVTVATTDVDRVWASAHAEPKDEATPA